MIALRAQLSAFADTQIITCPAEREFAMDENGKKFALTLVLWLVGLTCVCFLIVFVMLASSGYLSPDTH